MIFVQENIFSKVNNWLTSCFQQYAAAFLVSFIHGFSFDFQLNLKSHNFSMALPLFWTTTIHTFVFLLWLLLPSSSSPLSPVPLKWNICALFQLMSVHLNRISPHPVTKYLVFWRLVFIVRLFVCIAMTFGCVGVISLFVNKPCTD